jgi:hypothetical protein
MGFNKRKQEADRKAVADAEAAARRAARNDRAFIFRGWTMADQDPNVEAALEGLDQGKRETLRRLIAGSAFAGPVVVSFAMQGISIRPAHAAPGSSSNVAG